MSELNIVGLWIERLWRTKQSPARRHAIWALMERPDVNFHLTGPGFPDWDDSATGMVNINRIMPDCHAALSYKALGGCEYGRVIDPTEVSRHLVSIETWNELWPGTTDLGGVLHPGGGTAVQECRKAGIRLAVYHHGCERHRISQIEEYGGRVVHIPHGASPVFREASRPWNERSGIILTGSINETHYPLRTRWKSLIDSGAINGTYFSRPSNYCQSVEESERLVKQYADALGSARVVLGCSSRWRYALARIAECALAGCAHVCDVPDDLPVYTSLLHSVDPNASDDVLVAAVEYAMENAELIGRLAQGTALCGFTTAHYAERLVNVILEML